MAALRSRYAEVCTTAINLESWAFDGMGDFVSRLWLKSLVALENQLFRDWRAPTKWFDSKLDCLTLIRRAAADEELEYNVSDPPGASNVFLQLQSCSRDPQQRFHLLTTHYRHPFNFTAPTEDDIREYVLERLMVADRARIERYSLDSVDADDLLLKLNLVAIGASVINDLRFLDALNYFFELVPPDWCPKSRHSWLFVSFLALYAKALAIRIN